MQSFLLSGFDAFRAMRGAEEFITTVVTRERALMEAAFAGQGPGEQQSDALPAAGEVSTEPK
jgi:hypothetical protein